MQNHDKKTRGGRKIEFRPLDIAKTWRGNLTYQVWAVLPDGRHVLIGESMQRSWAVRFAQMVPADHQGKEIKVLIVESIGCTNRPARTTFSGGSASRRRELSRARLNRRQGGQIDWASFGREE